MLRMHQMLSGTHDFLVDKLGPDADLSTFERRGRPAKRRLVAVWSWSVAWSWTMPQAAAGNMWHAV